jgi:glycosyltransferase involved in cell wall biosynthesis
MANCLLNFQSSYSGGGLKRLVEFASYFNDRGGATFVVHPNALRYLNKFSRNIYVVERPSSFMRFFNRADFVLRDDIVRENWDVYYSYGVPLYKNIIARKRVVHISNVLPFVLGLYGYNFLEWLKFKLIFLNTIKTIDDATHVSAESKFTLSLIRRWHRCAEIHSQNGSNDEFESAKQLFPIKDNTAIVLGTHKHKDLMSSLAVFDYLLYDNPDLKLLVIGAKKGVPKALVSRSNVKILGVRSRKEVLNYLKASRYYISATRIENSFNAASEGIYFADISYVSSIPPHLELLEGLHFSEVTIPGSKVLMLEVKRDDLKTANLKMWSDVADDIFVN